MPKGGIQIIRRLQTGCAQLTTVFGFCRFSFQLEMLMKYSLQHQIDRILAVPLFQLAKHKLHELADTLDVSRKLFPLEMENVLSGMPLQVRRKGFCIMGAVVCAQHPLHSLQHLHQ
jgi:hypothetical protein